MNDDDTRPGPDPLMDEADMQEYTTTKTRKEPPCQ